jgi:hypothetical protein
MSKLDENRDGRLSLDEFVNGCLNDEIFLYLLVPDAATNVANDSFFYP